MEQGSAKQALATLRFGVAEDGTRIITAIDVDGRRRVWAGSEEITDVAIIEQVERSLEEGGA